MFPYNDDNVVFAWISRMRNILCFKMGDGILTRLFVLLIPRSHI